jgi:hypothetical protein
MPISVIQRTRAIGLLLSLGTVKPISFREFAESIHCNAWLVLRSQRVVLSDDGLEARPLRRLEISFSQGAEWKALMSKYIGAIPLIGDAAEQSISGGPPAGTAVSNAMMAKVGAAARHNQSAAPSAAARPLS